MSEIKNTTRAMREDPAEPLLALAEGMATGSPASFIERQERDGQAQLVNSDRLPVKGSRNLDITSLGFTFGPPDPGDPLFCPATLPAGWKREGSDHAMWSYICDELGRRRVAIFYKAAFYDRDAFMRAESLHSYVINAIDYEHKPVVFDDAWATRDAVREVLDKAAAEAREQAVFWQAHGDEKYVAEYEARAARYERTVAELGLS